MATHTKTLMGEVTENPEDEKKDVEHLLVGFLHALIEEQKTPEPL